MRVIVNADDLGMDEATNENIFNLMSQGKVTSSTMMANAPCIEEAVREAKNFPQCSFGVHLNLTEFHPLTDDERLLSLLDDEGRLRTENEDLKVVGATRKAIAKELSAQIARIQSYGVNISHLDSHQHIHNIPTMFPVIKYLQYKFNIKKIRLTREYPEAGRYGVKIRIKKKMYNCALRHFIRSKTTDGFSSLVGFMANAEQIRTVCNTFEIMVHPGTDEQEDAILNSSWQAAMPFEISYLNYHSL